jgi:hypothetical protein
MSSQNENAYWIDGRLLTERDLQDIQAQLEDFARIFVISDEMRDVIEAEWPDVARTGRGGDPRIWTQAQRE